MGRSKKSSNEVAGERRRLPQVDKVIRHELLERFRNSLRSGILTQVVRDELDRLRSVWFGGGGVQTGAFSDASSEDGQIDPSIAAEDESDVIELVAQRVEAILTELLEGGVRRVINGTGVILNTNLGRAPLPPQVLENMLQVGRSYSSLEIELESGKRGERNTQSRKLLRLLTGCESSVIVNNNASAVMLAVSSLASGKEVIVSRGELIEIGGSFRLPDVITSAGATLVEVGTTNRTRASDFRQAITDRTGLILRCHRSNFEIKGFTEEPSIDELVSISRECGVPLAEDLGSGALFDIATFGLDHETTVDEVIARGVDLVMFSGDKLLGGSQAGIVVGKEDLIAKLRKNAMYRALRADKLIIAMIEGVLRQYLNADVVRRLPVLRMAAGDSDSIKARVENFIERMSSKLSGKLELGVCPTSSTLGGGSLPGQCQPSFGLSLGFACKAEVLTRLLRMSSPPVVSVVQNETVVLDFRTVMEEDEFDLERILVALELALVSELETRMS